MIFVLNGGLTLNEDIVITENKFAKAYASPFINVANDLSIDGKVIVKNNEATMQGDSLIKISKDIILNNNSILEVVENIIVRSADTKQTLVSAANYTVGQEFKIYYKK